MIQRIYQDFEQFLLPGRVLVIYGPRRVGKTTIINAYLKQTKFKYKFDSGDNIRTRQILSSQDFPTILSYLEGYDLFVIDEAQQIPNIGTGLKIIVDQRPDIRVIATGSSSFELSNQIGEPLTGRKRTLTLFPVSQIELNFEQNQFELKEHVPDLLVFGSYPEILTAQTKVQKRELLTELSEAYLLKDILALEKIKSSKYLLDLLKLLAFQIGKEVSYQELARQLGLSVKTVQRYLDLLEKAFVVIRVGGFSRNLRSEVVRKSKYYFYDTGLRNAIISQFNDLTQRSDVGELWENFLFIERLKKRSYQSIFATPYFWRTYEGQEIDLIEEGEGQVRAYEFKWASQKKTRVPGVFQDAYPHATFDVIHPENYLNFVL
ncbi:ATP-binding protein [Candidatus Uhrbacteria bacterium]|nr:ATP-binding protein [Candidatus Uhrbacteria bacterium]